MRKNCQALSNLYACVNKQEEEQPCLGGGGESNYRDYVHKSSFWVIAKRRSQKETCVMRILPNLSLSHCCIGCVSCYTKCDTPPQEKNTTKMKGLLSPLVRHLSFHKCVVDNSENETISKEMAKNNPLSTVTGPLSLLI